MPTYRFFPFVAVPVLLFVIGCSGDRKSPPATSPSGNEAATGSGQTQRGEDAGGGFALRIEPAEVYRGTTVRVSSSHSFAAGTRIELLVRGAVAQSGDGFTFDTANLKKGDTIQVRALGAGGAAVSQVVTLRNSPPEVREIRFIPGVARQDGTLGVEVDTQDADGDPVRVEIAWRKNGEPAGTGNRLGAEVKRGDKVEVTITPHDGEGPGRSATLSREIRNTPPVIEGQEQFQVSGNVVTFHMRASDPDGDPLTYAIKDAPAGMQIDRKTGWVRWETAPGKTGKVPFTVLVSDGSGGESTALISVTIAEEPPSVAR